MNLLVIKFIFILALGTPETESVSQMHTANSGKFNLVALEQIESLISKKAGFELENNENSFTLNGHDIYTEVIVRRYGPSVYEESFCETQNPDNKFRMRLVKNVNGDRELAVMIRGEEGFVSYHACFDLNGNMLEDDPWGKDEGYTIEIFDLYKKYRKIYSQKVDAR